MKLPADLTDKSLERIYKEMKHDNRNVDCKCTNSFESTYKELKR